MIDPVPPPAPAPPWPAPRPRVWTVVLAVLVLFSSLVGLGLASFAVGGEIRRLSSLLVVGALSAACSGAVALSAAGLSPEPMAARLGLVAPRLSARGWAAAIVGGLAASQAADLALRLSGAGRGAPLERMLSLLATARGVDLAVALLVVGAFAGVAEELFFRGYVQRRLAARFGAAAGVAIAAGLFALAHFDPRHAAFALVFGAYVGAVAAWCGSTVPAIVVHSINNAVAVLLVVAGFDDARAGEASPALLARLVVVVVLALACAAWIRRDSRPAVLDGLAGPRVGSAP